MSTKEGGDNDSNVIDEEDIEINLDDALQEVRLISFNYNWHQKLNQISCSLASIKVYFIT